MAYLPEAFGGSVSSEPVRRRGRPPKFDTETARRLLVEEGVRRLRESGYEPSLGAVNLDHAIRATKVPRGAAYRLWGHEELAPQAQFRAAVLLRIFDVDSVEDVFNDLDMRIEKRLADVRAEFDSADADRRLSAMRSAIRTISTELQRAVRSNDAFRMSRSFARAADGTIGVPPEVAAAIARVDTVLFDRYAAIVSRMFRLFGTRVRSPFTFEHVVVLVTALNDGLLVPSPDMDSETVFRPTGTAGDLEEWSFFALGYEAIVAYFSDDRALHRAINAA